MPCATSVIRKACAVSWGFSVGPWLRFAGLRGIIGAIPKSVSGPLRVKFWTPPNNRFRSQVSSCWKWSQEADAFCKFRAIYSTLAPRVSQNHHETLLSGPKPKPQQHFFACLLLFTILWRGLFPCLLLFTILWRGRIGLRSVTCDIGGCTTGRSKFQISTFCWVQDPGIPGRPQKIAFFN